MSYMWNIKGEIVTWTGNWPFCAICKMMPRGLWDISSDSVFPRSILVGTGSNSQIREELCHNEHEVSATLTHHHPAPRLPQPPLHQSSGLGDFRDQGYSLVVMCTLAALVSSLLEFMRSNGRLRIYSSYWLFAFLFPFDLEDCLVCLFLIDL